MRGAEDPLERRPVLGRALLEQAEDRAAVVVHHDDREVRAGLARPDHQPVRVVQEGQVAEQRVRRAGGGEGGADRGRHGPVDAGHAAVGQHGHAGSRAGQEQVADRLGRPADDAAPPAGTASISVAATPGSDSPAWSSRPSTLARAAPRRPPARPAQPPRRHRMPRLRPPAAAGAAVGTAGRTRVGAVGRVGPGRAGGDDVERGGREQPGDRAAERRPADGQHPVRPVRGREPAAQQQVAAGQHARTGREPRARLGHDRPAAGLGQRDRRRGRRGRRVPEHHDRTGRQVVGDRPRRRRRHDLGPRPAAGPPGQRLRPALAAGRPAPAAPAAPGSACTGPGRRASAPAPAATARQTAERQYAFCPARVSGAPSSTNRAHRTPNRPSWSTVWFAPTPRSSGGRSAVSASSGTPACAASSTAGCRFAAAVPDVVTTAAGRPDAFASPSARNPADRSSIRTCSRSRPAASAACSANASGADREPGASTASRTPHRTSSSTSTRASAVDGFTARSRPAGRGSAAAGPPTRPAGPAARPARPAGPGPG